MTATDPCRQRQRPLARAGLRQLRVCDGGNGPGACRPSSAGRTRPAVHDVHRPSPAAVAALVTPRPWATRIRQATMECRKNPPGGDPHLSSAPGTRGWSSARSTRIRSASAGGAGPGDARGAAGPPPGACGRMFAQTAPSPGVLQASTRACRPASAIARGRGWSDRRLLPISGADGRRSSTGQKSAAKTAASAVATTLGADSCSDDEASELREFWQKLKAHDAASMSSLRISKPEPVTTLSAQSQIESEAPGLAQSAQSLTVSATTTSRPGSQRNNNVSSLRGTCASMCEASVPWTPSSKRQFLFEGRIWLLFEDLMFVLLCFLGAADADRMVNASRLLRSTCSVVDICAAGRRRMVAPHLVLKSKTCSWKLAKTWLPRILWLEAQDLDAKACGALFKTLVPSRSHYPRALLSLNLRNTKLSNDDDIVAMVRACQGLRQLDLGRARLRDEGAGRIALGLVFDPVTGDYNPHTALRHLCLEDNGLTGAVAADLARLALASPLEVLSLSRNLLGDVGAEALAPALRGCADGDCAAHLGGRLLRLDVSENRLTAAGLVSLLRAAGADSRLRSLEVGGNERIGLEIANSPDFAAEVALSLTATRTLRDLHLWRCGLPDAGYYLFAGCQPPQLEVLNLAANSFSPSLRQQLLSRNFLRCGALVHV